MSADNDRTEFESAIRSLEAQLANVGVHLVVDSAVREAYARQVEAMARDLRSQVQSGNLSWKQASTQAQEARNAIMEVMRTRSTPVGRSIVEKIKPAGKTLNVLIAEKTLKQFGKNADFHQLTPAQQNTVYAEIVKSAGKDSPAVSATMRKLSHAGRGLVVLSIAISVYSIATADDKVDATKRELAVTGAGIMGGIAGGPWRGWRVVPRHPCVSRSAPLRAVRSRPLVWTSFGKGKGEKNEPAPCR